jgi:hypothetical protein
MVYLGTRSYQPVIIIGAARSGTNMLRDILTQLPGFGTWPCDEIPYIWRHGNAREPTDEFGPELAAENVRRFIRQAFEWLVKKHALSYVVEKTCANSLRVGFVNRIFPEARFIHIIRDGRDVVVSARKRWTATLDISYTARKARFVPFSDVPYYAYRFLRNRIHRLVSGERRLAFWGPRFAGLEQALQQFSLVEVCAIQWQRCMENSQRDFASIDPSRVYQVRYETFVEQPKVELQRLDALLGVGITEQFASKLVQGVSSRSVGRWRTELDRSEQASVETLLRETLIRYGYD